jgi:hypothetical protein
MAKDAKGHGSESRGTSMADDRRANPNDPVAKAFGIAAKFGANSSQLGDHLREMARVQLNDMAAAKQLAQGNPKSDTAPDHSAMDRAVNEIHSKFSGSPPPRGVGASFGPRASRDGAPNPGSNIRAVVRAPGKPQSNPGSQSRGPGSYGFDQKRRP